MNERKKGAVHYLPPNCTTLCVLEWWVVACGGEKKQKRQTKRETTQIIWVNCGLGVLFFLVFRS